MARPGQRVIQAFDAKRAVTRFGVVEMPKNMDPDAITAEQLLTNRRPKLVPDRDLTDSVRKVLERVGVEPLPDLHPKPALTDAQATVMQVIAELSNHGACDWPAVVYNYAALRSLSLGTATAAMDKIADALIRRRLLNPDGPMLTLQGRARLKAQEEVEYWRARLGLTEYKLERIEPRPNRDYDEVYFIRGSFLECFYRHECFEIRAKVVVLSSLQLQSP